MRRCAAKVQLPSECRISHSSQSTYFDAVALEPRKAPRRVLILDSFGRNVSIFTVSIASFRAEVSRRWSGPLDLYRKSGVSSPFLPEKMNRHRIKINRHRITRREMMNRHRITRLIEMRQGGSAMPPSCFADTSGKRDISHNGPSPKSSPSESHPVAHLYRSKPPDGGSQIPKAKSTRRLAKIRGRNVCGVSRAYASQ